MANRSEASPVLIVDDQAHNLLALESVLRDSGIPLQLVTADSGDKALRLSLQQSFALVLLDVQMPGMNGFEVASLLRAHPKTQATPIIFVTAGMTRPEHALQGYATGAIDYLPKPIDPVWLVSKVRLFCELFQQRLKLQRSEQFLEQEVQRRTAELQALTRELEQRVEQRSQQLNQALAHTLEVERHAALGRMVAGVAHEMNTPVGNILLMSSTLGGELNRLMQTLKAERVSRQELLSIGEQCRSGAELIESNAKRAAALVVRFKEMGDSPDSEAPSTYGLRQTLESALAKLEQRMSEAGIQVKADAISDCEGLGYPLALERVIHQLALNSLTHGFGSLPIERSEPPTIQLRAELRAERVYLSFSDNGTGVPPHDLPRLFDPFFSTRFGQGGSGLGLSLVQKLVLEQMQGQITASSPPGEGLRLEITWPLSLASAMAAP